MPPEVLHRDIDKYREQNSSLVDMLRSSVAEHKPERFNRERCDIAFADDVEYDRLIKLATSGVVIDTPANLVRGLPQDPPRRLTKRLQTVYSKASYEVWRKGQGVILPRDQLSSRDQSLLKDNHPHFQPKYLAKEGRFLMDCYNSDSGQVLNTPEVKEAVIARYAKIVHPTLHSIFNRWYEFARRNNVELKQCLGWKCDFKGAFA